MTTEGCGIVETYLVMLCLYMYICTYIHAGTHQVQGDIQEQVSRESSDDRKQAKAKDTSGMMSASLYS